MIRHWRFAPSTMIRTVPRWLFFVTLVYAPWAYGCTTEKTVEGLNWLLAATLGLWLISSVLTRRTPVVPLLLMVTAGATLLFGWWMVVNARAIFDPEFLAFVPTNGLTTTAPGSIDRAISAAWMLRVSLLLGTVVFVADLCRRAEWLLRVWWTVVLAGASIALLGLLQKASNAEMIFWLPRSTYWKSEVFFATYYYHANAGAYLNLVLPLAAGLAARSVGAKQPIQRALSVTAVLLMLAALIANTSRVAHVITACAVLVLGWSGRGYVANLARAIGWKAAAAVSVGAALVLAAVIQGARLRTSFSRWAEITEHLPSNERWDAAEAALHSLPEAGWFGFGPGTFRVAFPYLTGYVGDRVQGVWRFLHQDYLQTLLEWGYVGTALWASLVCGGIVTAICALRSRGSEAWTPRRRLLLPLVVLALATLLTHALVDFPLQIASIQLYVATYLGICWGSARWRQEIGSGRRDNSRTARRTVRDS